MRCRTKWAQALLALLFIMMTLLEVVEGSPKQAKPRRRRIKKSRAGVGKDFSEFLLVIGAIMTCVIAPVFAFFLHSIYKDPAAPELARACLKAIKEKLLSYLGGQQPAMPDSSVDRSNSATDASSVLRATSRRRKISTIDPGNEAAFWAADRGAERRSSTLLPPSISRTTTTDRLQHPRRHAENESWTQDFPRNYPREKELSERRADPATMAPHSSGALLPPWRVGRGAGSRAGANREAAGAPKWWREGGGSSRAPSRSRRKGFLSESEEEYVFGPGTGMEWGPYPDIGHGNEYDEQEVTGRGSETRGVYKSAWSKRRMSRSKRTRGVKGSALGDSGGAGTGVDGGCVGGDTVAGRFGGLS